MYNYYFHFNPHTGNWAAFKTHDIKNYTDHMYPCEDSKAIFASDINVLFDMIKAHNPDVEDRGFKIDH